MFQRTCRRSLSSRRRDERNRVIAFATSSSVYARDNEDIVELTKQRAAVLFKSRSRSPASWKRGECSRKNSDRSERMIETKKKKRANRETRETTTGTICSVRGRLYKHRRGISPLSFSGAQHNSMFSKWHWTRHGSHRSPSSITATRTYLHLRRVGLFCFLAVRAYPVRRRHAVDIFGYRLHSP